ncbi:hypothetical protein DABAL43B_1136 [Psychrobacter sp. DAB_AL43B]|nr:hypothetical protein DABAL43B_1136 [Psychrobacter sp. DAB_AL43B]
MNSIRSLNLESIYSQGYDIFFSNLNDNINYLEPPFDNPKLFAFYEKYIEETLLFGNNDIKREMANLLEVMLWAFFRVWAKRVIETGLITYSLGSENKLIVLDMFLDNLDNEEGAECLSIFNSNLSNLKSQIK